MKKLRKLKDLKIPEPPVKRRVKVLYVNADEDHISLLDGSSTIVPLISIHEGIKRQGQRQDAKDDSEKKRIWEFNRNIRKNWAGIAIHSQEECGGSCTEGHVSHVLSKRLSSQYAVIFFECGLDDYFTDDESTITNLQNFVTQGGSIYASDWAYSIVEAMYPEKIDFADKIGSAPRNYRQYC